MKALTALALAILMALSTTALAEEEKASCEQIASIAKTIMTSRQGGVSMVSVMGVARDSELLQKMTVDAYEQGRYFSKEIQERQIQNFHDKWYMWCFKIDAQ